MKLHRLRIGRTRRTKERSHGTAEYCLPQILPPQTATEGRMSKVLPEHVRRSGTAVVGACADEEGRPNAGKGGQTSSSLDSVWRDLGWL